MKLINENLLRVASLGLFIMISVATTTAQDARIKTAQLDALAGKASQTVDVNLDGRLMQLAAKFLNTKDPDEASVKEMVNGLKGIYVKFLEFDAEGQYTTADLDSIRSQVRNAPWSRIVDVRSKREGSVEVYLLLNGNQVGGLAIIAFSPKEMGVVNIVGPVDLDKLSKLEGNFGIPDLEIQSSKPKPKNE